jgi:hypothetical protein
VLPRRRTAIAGTVKKIGNFKDREQEEIWQSTFIREYLLKRYRAESALLKALGLRQPLLSV